MLGRFAGVWITRRIDIARHWAATHPSVDAKLDHAAPPDRCLAARSAAVRAPDTLARTCPICGYHGVFISVDIPPGGMRAA